VTVESVPSPSAASGQPGAPAAAGGAIPRAELALVGRYIASNDTKGAVKKAKAIHGHFATAESEALLVDAYVARIRAMESAGMATEAASLTELVAGRYASAASRLREAQAAPAAAGNIVEMAGELARPDLPPERRTEIEEAIRRDLTELPSLARCEALPPDHPLRQAAGAICRAFQAVVTGPADEEQLALREVSRRSPLSDWKLLVRAIGCFYRHEDDACRRLLEAMRDDSAAARLTAALRAMLDGRADGRLGPAAAALVAAVEGADRELPAALADLERGLQREDLRKVPTLIRRAVELCRKARPELLDRLKQLISVRTFGGRISVPAVIPAMGGSSLHDSGFWSLLARAMETRGDNVIACMFWEEFRRHGVHEKRFAADGPEAVAVWLHMTDLLRQVSPESLRCSREDIEANMPTLQGFYEGQPPAIRALAPPPGKRPDLYCLYPERIYERLCRHVTDAEIYARWLEHARKDGQSCPSSQEVAERWHRGVATDSRPLLFLMEQAERRKAFTKAMKYLRQAEDLDALSPAVKRARLRLWVASALRHLQAGKPHLAAKDFEALHELPQAREGDRPATLAGLEWVACRQAGDAAGAAEKQAHLAGLFGGQDAAAVLLTCLGRATAGGAPPVPESAPPAAGEPLLRAVGRTCTACRDMGVPVMMPPEWRRPLAETLAGATVAHDLPELRAIAEGALGVAQRDIAFAAAGAALRAAGPHRARFLLLRARSLPQRDGRWRECLDVAAELARRQRDTDLLAEVMDELGTWFAVHRRDEVSVAEEVVERVLAREAAAMPADVRQPAVNARTSAPARRGASRRRQAALFEEAFGGDEDDYDAFADEDDEEDEWDGEIGAPEVDGLPPAEIMNLILEIVSKVGGSMPSDEDMERLLRSDAGLRRRVERVMRKYGQGGMEEIIAEMLGIGGRDRRPKRNKRWPFW